MASEAVEVTFPSGTKATCSAELAEVMGLKPAAKKAAPAKAPAKK